MADKVTVRAELLHDAKRVYVYSYSADIHNLDGKITIAKRLLSNGDIDIVEALERREIEIENASACKNKIFIPPVEVDEAALTVISRILNCYEVTGNMPISVEK